MSTVVAKRPERRRPPQPPRGEILLESPPEIPEIISGGFSQMLMYLPMVAGGAAMGLMFMGSGGGNPIMYVASGMFGLSMVGMMFGQMGRTSGERKQRLNGQRRDYYRYLAQVRKKVRRAAEQQREALEWNSPDPGSLWSLVMSARLWERRIRDNDFGHIRIGTGPQRLAVQLVTPETKPVEDLEPMCAGALRRFVRAHSTVPQLPVAVSLPSFARIVPTGDPELTRGMVRAMLSQIAAFHSPDDIKIGVCASPDRMPYWEWVKWLPHSMPSTDTDAAGAVRLMANSLSEIEAMFGATVKDRPRFTPGLAAEDLPYHIVVVDGGLVTPDSQIGADGIEGVCVIDLTGSVATNWRPRAPRNRLRVPVGIDVNGAPVELDIKEAAQGGFGPHGLCIGATGSGKSEFLRTLVLGLAMTHSSEVLNFVLVDFKGGATFLGMDELNHVAAVITNLEDELPLVDRMYDALHGEMVRRQEFLRAAGNYASLRDYERAREQGANLVPMPTLFIVLDEFSELLSAKPDFIELFVMIGRLGRSLGVHLLLASQRLEEGKLRGLDTHLSYRIGLRTFSAMESRVVLGVPDAHELPQAPGNGYLKVGTETMTRVKAAYVSGPASEDAQDDRQSGPKVQKQIVPFGAAYMRPAIIEEPAAAKPKETGSQESLFDVVVKQLIGHGPPPHQIWLPPLEDSPTLDQLLPNLTPTPQHGFTTSGWDGRGRLHAVAGIVDRPFDQWRDPFWLDLSGASGHVAAVGSPQAGKSTLLRTLIASLALMHTPQEAQFYCLDFGGRTLTTL